jgi:nucleotide-binding universal stress UspA family protein
MKFEKILFHTQFREKALSSLEVLLDLTKVGLKEIVLVYVIPREEVAFLPFGGYMKEEEEKIKKKAGEQFKQWQALLAKKKVKSKTYIQVGVPNAVILDIADKEKVDMIVAGRKKRSLFEKVYVGTHMLDLIRRSPIPILMDKYMAEYEQDGKIITRINEHIFDRPMLATDWSQPSSNAVDALAGLKGLATDVVVVHNIGVKISKAMSPVQLQELKKESRRRLKEYCRRLTAAGLNAESHLSSGRTASELIDLSRKYNSSMIVLGRTGKDWLSQYWLGGVSHRVAENSELPVLLIP